MNVYLPFIKFIIIGAFVKILVETNKAWLCALGLSLVSAFFVLISIGAARAAMEAVLMFVAGFGYFYLLDRLEGSGTWWVVLILGGVILLAL